MTFCKKMNSRTLNSIGLILGIIGVVFLFVWGSPQPSFTEGTFMAVEDGTVIDKNGTTAGERDESIRNSRERYTILSRCGLSLIAVGFVFQIAAAWTPIQSRQPLER